MKKIIKLLILAGGTLIGASCADLDIRSDGRVSYKDIFSHYERTVNYYNNCTGHILSVGFTYDNSPLASFCDEAQDASDYADGNISNWYNGYTTSSYNPLGDVWAHYYSGIRKCNTFLLYINDPEVTTYDFREVEKEGWEAQIRVARAYYYLQLIKRYGGVPLLKVPYGTNHDYTADRRATFEECADFIISECRKALATEEPTGNFGFRWNINDSERGKITRAFAYAVMSQTALYAASPLWNDGTSKYTWEKATEITKEALDQCLVHGFELYATKPAASVANNAYEYYFFTQSDPSRSWDKETIYESGARTNVWKWAGTPITRGMEKAGAGPSQELVDAYETIDGQPVLNLDRPYLDADHLEPNYNEANVRYKKNNPYADRDPRFYASIYYNGAKRYLDTRTDIVETYVGGNCGISDDVTDIRFTRTGYYLRKFNNYRSGIEIDGDGFIRIFRLAELYLNFAEAAYQAKGPDVLVKSTVGGQALSARAAVDVVRARAGMPGLPRGLSKDVFGKRYRNERRVELAFEEHRFFDVRRWKILQETDGFVTGMKIDRALDGSYTYNRIKLMRRDTNSDKYLMSPIRQAEVDKMEGYTGTSWQNPGW
ncbi:MULTISPECIES: RagB/SusD family nutrient uptake outer membrane protein [Bacteroides]|uniref:RagB/SusD family nutrient uptake outer membrane protein n=1 Tax=Bacteroides TaxID=816 RepID=UPI00158B2952|nr:RagB/SusD family nutrient uptake outer membrane protein [Bacteroides acidifaciens]